MLSTDFSLPAIGQGVLGLEVRKSDHVVRDLIGFLNHGETELTVRAERAFLKELEGDAKCRLPGMVNSTAIGLNSRAWWRTWTECAHQRQAFRSEGEARGAGSEARQEYFRFRGDTILQKIYRK